jgi:autophagy-related protein 17
MTHSQTGAGDLVSISGVMQPHDGSSSQSELDPTSSEDRAEAIAVVVQDASQVDEVVAALQEGLAQMEVDFASLSSQADRIRTAYTRAVASFAALEEVGQRLRGYVAAEGEFLERWGAEKDAVLTRLEEMDALQLFYDKYLSAYDSLLFEMERRKAVEDKIQSILRKARDNVQKLVEADHRERDAFRQDIGDYVPTDLWAHWNRPLPTWHIVSVDDGGETQDRTDASGLETDRGGSSVRR